MYSLPTLALALVALIAAQSEQRIGAPVPKDSPPPSIEGKYNIVSVSTPDQFGPGGAGGFGGAGFPGGGIAKGPNGRIVRIGPGGVMYGSMAGSAAVISKNEITLEGNAWNGPAGMGTTMEYTLDPSKSPVAIDVEVANMRGKKTKQLGVLEMNGNRLVLALAKEGNDRPKNTEEAEDVTVYYFQKQPPPPRTEYRIVAMTAGKEAEAEKELNKLSEAGFELVTTTQPVATRDTASPTVTHFVLKRTVQAAK